MNYTIRKTPKLASWDYWHFETLNVNCFFVNLRSRFPCFLTVCILRDGLGMPSGRLRELCIHSKATKVTAIIAHLQVISGMFFVIWK